MALENHLDNQKLTVSKYQKFKNNTETLEKEIEYWAIKIGKLLLAATGFLSFTLILVGILSIFAKMLNLI